MSGVVPSPLVGPRAQWCRLAAPSFLFCPCMRRVPRVTAAHDAVGVFLFCRRPAPAPLCARPLRACGAPPHCPAHKRELRIQYSEFRMKMTHELLDHILNPEFRILNSSPATSTGHRHPQRPNPERHLGRARQNPAPPRRPFPPNPQSRRPPRKLKPVGGKGLVARDTARSGGVLAATKVTGGRLNTGVLPDASQVAFRLAAAAQLPPWRFGLPHYATASVVQVRLP